MNKKLFNWKISEKIREGKDLLGRTIILETDGENFAAYCSYSEDSISDSYRLFSNKEEVNEWIKNFKLNMEKI